VNAWSWASEIGRALLDLLYPVFCVGCRQPGTLYCPACRTTVRRITPPLCPLCGQPQHRVQLCPQCTHSLHDKEREPPIDGIRSVAYLEGTLQEAIYGLKYSYIQELADPLGEMLIEHYNRAPLPADIIIPVPLHRRRRRARGYNQSALLAQRLGQATQIPVRRDLLHRHRYTRSQTRLNAQERNQNVQGAFSCTDRQSIEQDTVGKRILLIDDVATTGATLRACAQVLQDHGARSVWALTVARAAPSQRT
jgi:competence protein ComFC